MYINTKVVVFYASLGRHKWSLFETETVTIVLVDPGACGCRRKVDTVGKVITFDTYSEAIAKGTPIKVLAETLDIPEDLMQMISNGWRNVIDDGTV